MKWLPFDFRDVKPTLALALPIAAGNLSGMLMGWVDTLMVGRLGVVPLAAVAFSITIWMLFYFLGSGFVLAVSARAAEAHGARDIPSLANWLSACLVITLTVGILTTAAALACIHLFPFLGQEPEVIKACTGFYICIVLSLIPSFIWLGLKTFLDALGKPWIGFLVLIGSLLMNIFLNWLLIFGNWGCPRLEIVGAGVATLLGRLCGAGSIILIFFLVPQLRYLLFHSLKWPWQSAYNLTRLGIPITSQMLSESIAFNVGAIMIGWLGAIPLAAHQIAITMLGTTYMIPLGVGTALTIRMGNLLGAGENFRLRGTVYGTILTTCILMGCVGIAVIIFSGYIPSWFVDSAPVHQIATQLLIIMGILQIIDALYILTQCGLRGFSDVHFPAATNVFAYLGFGLSCAYVLGMLTKLHAAGVWMGLFLGTALSTILCLLRLRKKVAISTQNNISIPCSHERSHKV